MLNYFAILAQGFPGVVPDVITFNVGISAYMAQYRNERAFELLDEMTIRGVRPRADTFNSILTGLTKVHPFLLLTKRHILPMRSVMPVPSSTLYRSYLVVSRRLRPCVLAPAESPATSVTLATKPAGEPEVKCTRYQYLFVSHPVCSIHHPCSCLFPSATLTYRDVEQGSHERIPHPEAPHLPYGAYL